MTDKELRRLSRAELLHMLIAQIEENEALRQRADDAERQLQDRQLACDKAGNIAQAALQVSGVFEAAQDAAKQYLENIERLSGEQEAVCRRMLEQAQREADDIVSKAHAEADEYWRRVIDKIKTLVQTVSDSPEAVAEVERNPHE